MFMDTFFHGYIKKKLTEKLNQVSIQYELILNNLGKSKYCGGSDEDLYQDIEGDKKQEHDFCGYGEIRV